MTSTAHSASSANPTPNTNETVCLHDSGDVTLLIGIDEHKQAVLVSSSVLRLASPVWKAMLDRHWAESEAQEIPFPDDDVAAMLLVLRIAHLQFHDLPPKKGLSFEDVLQLAILCDKYDLVKLVRPFLDLNQWAEPFKYSKATGYRIYQPKWLFVAWTFGYENSFDELARRLALTITIAPDGTAKTDKGDLLGPDLPIDILGMSPA